MDLVSEALSPLVSAAWEICSDGGSRNSHIANGDVCHEEATLRSCSPPGIARLRYREPCLTQSNNLLRLRAALDNDSERKVQAEPVLRI